MVQDSPRNGGYSSRVVKIFETPETVELGMVDGLHEERQLGPSPVVQVRVEAVFSR